MQLYLDAVGGVAGDMFAAAMLDAWPTLGRELKEALRHAGLDEIVEISVQPHTDGILTGTRFHTAPSTDELRRQEARDVPPAEHGHPHRDGDSHLHPRPPESFPNAGGGAPTHHSHRPYRVIAQWLDQIDLAAGARKRAHDIFQHLAKAEAQVHGIEVNEVTFHEVGAWDSIADVVAAAWLIDAVGEARWFSAPLPMGRGRVRTAHGQLPLPAPAAAVLLEGMPLFQDELEGERITPTGAAILKHLDPTFSPMGNPGVLTGTGTGFGSRSFPGLSNVLRVSRFESTPATATARPLDQTVVVCQFEIDDQTPEDLAEALEHLRGLGGVLDVIQIPALGKKGRFTNHVQLLLAETALNHVAEAILSQTSTLGLRWQLASRVILARSVEGFEVDGQSVMVKRAIRPDGATTAKAEHADVARLAKSYATRKRVRERAEQAALSRHTGQPSPEENSDEQ